MTLFYDIIIKRCIDKADKWSDLFQIKIVIVVLFNNLLQFC